jgi:hypothetical protein
MKVRHVFELLFLGAGLCASASAAPVVGEYGGHSSPHDYEWQATETAAFITIKEPSAVTYDFDCYDSITGEPAVIGALTTASGTVGNLYVRVSPHDGRQYGASDVWLLQIQQAGSLTGVLEDFQIGGNYGLPDEPGGPLLADAAYNILIVGDVDDEITQRAL